MEAPAPRPSPPDSFLRSVFLDADAGTETADEAAARVAAVRREAGWIEAQVSHEQARLRAVAEKVKAAQEEQGRAHWWEVDVDALREAELPEFATALDALRADVLRRLAKLAEARKPPRRQCGYKPALEALLLDGIIGYDEFFIAKAHFVFGEGHVIVIL
uniref:Uncharacterized protein n=1 Tax=Aegilops tauschii TaxID=37682 RepID=N1R1G7_AEGTA